MTNTNNTVLYTGDTNNLERRVQEHKDKKGSSFTSKYNVTKLVFYERFDRIYDAIGAEKKIKAGSRAKKNEIIEAIILTGKICIIRRLLRKMTRVNPGG